MMKKYFLFLPVIALLCCACTSKEQDQKIQLFWLQQMATVSQKMLPGQMSKLAAMQAKTLGTKKANLPTSKSPVRTEAKVSSPLKAMLFVSPQCGRCQRLKKDGWAEKFREQYDGQIILTEYDLSVPQNEELLHSMMRKHKMNRIGYPAFFIGSSVAHGYPLAQQAEKITQKELAAFIRNNPSMAAPKPLPQIIEVTMDSDEIKGKAPQSDLDRMKRAINAVQLSNQKTLTDIGTTFGESVKNKAMIITTETEQKLRAEATKAASFTAFFAKQKELISTQNQRLNQLMAQNTQNIRRIKTRSKSL